MDSQTLTFDSLTTVRVTLTGCGEQILVSRCLALGIRAVVLRNGKPVDFHFWELMQIFGNHLAKLACYDDDCFVGGKITVLGPEDQIKNWESWEDFYKKS